MSGYELDTPERIGHFSEFIDEMLIDTPRLNWLTYIFCELFLPPSEDPITQLTERIEKDIIAHGLATDRSGE